jgi:predicted 2-oxoglutarate/Fe(II)-dependent dioxygenase YbiX
MQGIHDNFMEILTPILYGYAKMFNIVDNLQLEGITLLKYSQLQYYAPHYDTHPDAPRVLSAICYMNDDYEGGELEFINFNIKIKPEPGMLVLFPSNFAYTHTAHPVTSGFKYSLVTWLRDQQYTIS